VSPTPATAAGSPASIAGLPGAVEDDRFGDLDVTQCMRQQDCLRRVEDGGVEVDRVDVEQTVGGMYRVAERDNPERTRKSRDPTYLTDSADLVRGSISPHFANSKN